LRGGLLGRVDGALNRPHANNCRFAAVTERPPTEPAP
jgi:hypothetical protein